MNNGDPTTGSSSVFTSEAGNGMRSLPGNAARDDPERACHVD
jgi:hypothetical protein